MKLQIFSPANHRGGSRTQYRAISINRRNAKISFTRQATEELALTTENSIAFAKDSDSKGDWYISLTTETQEALPLRAHNGSGNAKGYSTLGITSRGLSSILLDELKAKSGATILIAQKPTVIDGQEWYQLIMAKPLRIN